MKRNLAIVVLLSILPLVVMFTTPLLPHTSDGGVHLPRMAAYVKALADGHFPVRWAGDLNYGYGLPLFNFMYPLPYLLSSVFVFLGFGLVPTFKIVLALSFIFSGVFMYLFTREWLGREDHALFITLFYQFAPFRLVEIVQRGAVGGIYAYTFFPLVCWGIVKVIKKPSVFHIALTALATTLLIISHNSLSLVFFAIALVFSRGRFAPAGALLWGLLMASWYWLPALAEHKFTYGDLFMKDMYKSHFPAIQNFFIPNFTNDVRFRTAEISVQLGLFHVIGIILAVYGLFCRHFDKRTKKILLFGLVGFVVALFLMQPASGTLWERVSLLRQFQFPWRLLAVTSFSTALIAIAYTRYVNVRSPLYSLILILLVGTTSWYWRPPEGFDRVRESDYWNYPLNTTYFGETDVIWSAGQASAYPKNRVEFAAGSGTIENLVKKTQLHTFTVQATSPATVVDRTQYFPGWRVYVDGKKVPIEFQDQNWRGLITFPVPAGHHDVRVVFEESPIRAAADVISILAGMLLISYVVYILR